MTSEDAMIREISSWIHDEVVCVTVKRIGLTFGICKTEAARLLEKLPKKNQSYRVTRSRRIVSGGEDCPVTTFRLVQSEWKEEDSKDVLYALALDSCTQTLHTAHEQDMSLFRECLQEGRNLQEPLLVQPDGTSSMDQASALPKHNTAAPSHNQHTTTKPPLISASRQRLKKATTAADFFKNNKTTTKTAVKSVHKTNKTTVKSVHKRAAVGNADDFVGDVDEEDEPMDYNDDDDVVVMQIDAPEEDSKEPEKTVPPKKERPTKSKKTKAPPPGTASMNAFVQHKNDENNAKTSTAAATKKPKRRRRKLVEKNTQDENGYLVTTSDYVWEDVSDSEETPVATKPKPSSKPKANLKQGSIMGFFTKK